MGKVEELINRITEFGLTVKVQSDDNELEIQQLLIGLYSEYLHLNTEFDAMDFEDGPNFDYDDIRSIVVQNFPNFGGYHSIFDSHKINVDAELVIEDSIDDLTDIIKDMMDVKWRFENNGEKDALYQFQFWMKHHSEQHLVNLIKYLKDLKG